MKLTKLQRYTAYILMRNQIGKGIYNGRFCHLIFTMFGISNKGWDEKWSGKTFVRTRGADSIDEVTKYFPELSNKKPWTGWPERDKNGIQWRKDILDQCIEETAP